MAITESIPVARFGRTAALLLFAVGVLCVSPAGATRYRGYLFGAGYDLAITLRGRPDDAGLFNGKLRCRGELCIGRRATFQAVPPFDGPGNFRGHAVFVRQEATCFFDGSFTTSCAFGNGQRFEATDPNDLICGPVTCTDVFNPDNELGTFGFVLQRR